MKKFEEEFNENINLIKTALGDVCSVTHVKAVFKEWVSPEDYQAKVDELNKKIDWLHGLLDERNEEVLQTVKRLNEAIPEIPEFVGKYIKETADPIHEMCAWAEHYGDNGTKCDDPELSKMLDWFGRNRNMFYEAVIKGYTVKEKRFYLKHIDMSKKYNSNVCVLAHGERDVIYGHCDFPVGVFPSDNEFKFTQSQIDSMETGSYEQILVEEN